jgi:hypothetical protein
MDTINIFRCYICESSIGNPHLCFDRRIEKLGVIGNPGEPTTSINIAYCQTLLMYCSHECWQRHQADLATALEFKNTYPPFGFVTPCCRCGKPVNRTKSYVCYNISEMALEGSDVLIGHCIDDTDFAVVCPECELPDTPETNTSANITIDEEEGAIA